ncbi:MAG TPA: branched-chain amino acid ABC transporter permease [Polyangia bacterium]|nr:branched-chain amino acid ABC transporter permease [Polyangia bacterium]
MKAAGAVRRGAPITIIIGAAVCVLLAAAPALLSPFLIQFLINFFMLAVLAESWNIIGGFTGYASFGNAGFFGVGAYATGILLTVGKLPFALALPAGGAMAMAFAALIGTAVLRLKGQYFAIATLGVTETTREIVYNLNITGGGGGLSLPMVRSPLPFFYMMLAVLVAAVLINFWIARSRFGYGLRAIREDEDAAAAMGIPTARYKTLAFALSGGLAGLAGGVFGYWITFLDPGEVFKVSWTIRMIIMAVFGGAGTVLGPLLGSAVLVAIFEGLSTQLETLAELCNGLVVIAVVLFMPQGLIDAIAHRRLSPRKLLQNLRQYRI